MTIDYTYYTVRTSISVLALGTLERLHIAVPVPTQNRGD